MVQIEDRHVARARVVFNVAHFQSQRLRAGAGSFADRHVENRLFVGPIAVQVPHVVIGVTHGDCQIADLLFDAVLAGDLERAHLRRVERLVVDDRRKAHRHEQVADRTARIAVDRVGDHFGTEFLLRHENQTDLLAVYAASLLDVALVLDLRILNPVGLFRQELSEGLRDLRIEHFQIFGSSRSGAERACRQRGKPQQKIPHRTLRPSKSNDLGALRHCRPRRRAVALQLSNT